MNLKPTDLPLWQSITERLRLLERNGWRWKLETGRLGPTEPLSAQSKNIWIYGPELDFSCTLWKDILYEIVFRKRRIPSHCQECYKVVAKPRTLAELHMCYSVQHTVPGLGKGKCGIETRSYVPRLYGAYWYNRGLEEGLATYTKVRNLLPADIPVILKRGCTEYEMDHGDSADWQYDEEQVQLENEVSAYIEFEPFGPMPNLQPPPIVKAIQWLWIKWAFAHGDTTYLQFTKGRPLHPEYRTYHHKAQPTIQPKQTALPFNPDGEENVE